MHRKKMENKWEVLGIINGCFCIITIMIFNPWVVPKFMSTTGKILPFTQLLIMILDILFAFMCLFSFKYRKSDIFKNFLLIQISIFICTPLIGEVVFRTGVSLKIPYFFQARLYFDPYSTEAFWKINAKWTKIIQTDQYKSKSAVKLIRDRILGWAPEKTLSNPLGIITDKPYNYDSQEKVILFFGDSYVEGFTLMNDKLPQQIDKLLTDHKVYNLGVFGYGLCQTYLRFKEVSSKFKSPIILFGILTEDIDRTILGFRDDFKPYYSVENGKLLLKGVPIDKSKNTRVYLDNYNPNIRSYFYAFIKERYKIIIGNNGWGKERKEEKIRVNSMLIAKIINEAQKNHQKIIFIIFYRLEELKKPSWRVDFLKKEIKKSLGIYIDTGAILIEKAKENSIDFDDLFELGHPNELANRIMAKSIAMKIKKYL